MICIIWVFTIYCKRAIMSTAIAPRDLCLVPSNRFTIHLTQIYYIYEFIQILYICVPELIMRIHPVWQVMSNNTSFAMSANPKVCHQIIRTNTHTYTPTQIDRCQSAGQPETNPMFKPFIFNTLIQFPFYQIFCNYLYYIFHFLICSTLYTKAVH